MKKTRQINIQNKVFTAEDLRRIAKIFDNVAKATSSRHMINYGIDFSDNTRLETETPELFTDEALATPGRAVIIKMSFHNYSEDNHLTFSLTHGNLRYGNVAVISSSNEAWLSENFLALKDAIDAVAPQDFWFLNHKTLLFHLLALGTGTIGMMLISGFIRILFFLFPFHSPPPSSPVLEFVFHSPLRFIIEWSLRWLAGATWCGAPSIENWLLYLYPQIEFKFGLEHNQVEELKRKRLYVVLTVIIFPILMGLIVDLIQNL